MLEKKEIKVLMIPSWYIPEGGQFCRNQAQALCENGTTADILANVTISLRKYGFFKALSLKFKQKFSYEDNLLVMRNYHISLPFFKKLDGVLWSYQTYRMFKIYCKKQGKPDIIHVHSVLWGGYAAYLINKKLGIPYVITEHKGIFGMSCDFAKNSFIDSQTPYMQKAFSNASRIIVVSENLIPKIQTFLTKKVHCSVVSNVVDTSFFHYKKQTNTSDTINCVCVNGFIYVKGYDVLFPAFDKACDSVSNLYLTIVGEDFQGKEFERLWKAVKHKDKIKFTGELNKFGVRDELWKADFFVISSRVESQSVSTLEALSTGLPIVCTEVIPLQIADQTNSIRVSVENVEELSDGIIEMGSKFNEYNREKIASTIQNIASKKVVANKLIEIYRELTDKK